MRFLKYLKIVFIVGIISLLLIMSFFLKGKAKNSSKKNKNIIPSPTAAFQFYPRSTSITPLSSEGDKMVITPSKLVLKSRIDDQDMQFLIRVQKSLPYKSDSLYVFYSPLVGKVIVVTKDKKNYKKEIENWIKDLKEKGIIPKNFDIFSSKVVSFVSKENFEGENYEEEFDKEISSIIQNSSPVSEELKDFLTRLAEGLSEFSNALYEYMRQFYPSLYPSPSPESALKAPIKSFKIPKPLKDLFSEVERKVGVPERVLEAVLYIESPQFYYLPDTVLEEYLSGKLIDGCVPNQCSAVGPMQITVGVDTYGSSLCSNCCWKGKCLDSRGGCPNQWGIYGKAINIYAGEKGVPNPCNLRHNIYAAAAKLKNDSGAQDLNWSKEQVFTAAERYYGDCSVKYKRLGNRSYCEFVWEYYEGK